MIFPGSSVSTGRGGEGRGGERTGARTEMTAADLWVADKRKDLGFPSETAGKLLRIWRGDYTSSQLAINTNGY